MRGMFEMSDELESTNSTACLRYMPNKCLLSTRVCVCASRHCHWSLGPLGQLSAKLQVRQAHAELEAISHLAMWTMRFAEGRARQEHRSQRCMLFCIWREKDWSYMLEDVSTRKLRCRLQGCRKISEAPRTGVGGGGG